MNRRLSIAVAAALAASGFVYTSTAEDKPADAARAADAAAADASAVAAAATDAAKASFPTGIKLKTDAAEEDRKGVIDTIDDATSAALTKDGFNDLVERLVDQDRNRIGKDDFTDKKFEQLNAQVESFRNAWKTKYGDDFDVEEKALSKVTTLAGEIEDASAIAGAWPVAAIADGGDAVPAAARQPADPAAPAAKDEDANLEKGRDVSIATIPASHGLPAVNVSLIQELGGYRIDIPNSITGQQLHDSLLKHLTEVNQAQAQWPADANDAQLLVAHHIALGVYGVEKDAARAGGAASDAARQAKDATREIRDAAKDATD